MKYKLAELTDKLCMVESVERTVDMFLTLHSSPSPARYKDAQEYEIEQDVVKELTFA